ncbi:hypothetical protein EW146_g5925 [Bondarzewia mesenterica]|uniref:Dipeptidyl-peptidase V n=1 Tax=Bondarzewia mesenterica TaxID=1095465 RepID=A0A4S4LR31_9AGAM|nr:hypothetical protein EW146_g5925 [Bondarzewia mesenterica]
MSAPCITTLTPVHSPRLIASTDKIRAPRISPDGTRIIYEVQPFYRQERSTCALWIVEAGVDVESSVGPKTLTDGEWNDRAAAWLPDGKRVLFLSNRAGKSVNIYMMDVGSRSIVPVFREGEDVGAGVAAFEISPDGRTVAFTSPDAASAEGLERAKTKDDAKVYGEKTRLARLRVCDLESGAIRTLRVRRDMHVESFSWSQSGKELVYRLRENRGTEYSSFQVVLEKIAADDARGGETEPVILGKYHHTPSGSTILTATGHIIELQSYDASRLLDARSLFVHAPNASFQSYLTSDPEAVTRLYGVKDDAVRLVDLGGNADTGYVAVEVSAGVDTHIDIVRTTARGGAEVMHTVFATRDDAIWFGAWDARRILGVDGRAEFMFAGVLSSGPRHEPPNVHVCRVEGDLKVDDHRPIAAVKLSSHLQWLLDAPAIRTQVLQWTSNDGIQLDGMVRFPPGYDDAQGALPTVLFIHGGPYRRDIPDYMPYFCNWREMLASAGYLVISPNYRGSQGRGHEFAAAAGLGIGVLDWPDCEGMLDEAIKRGWADPERLGVAGWSHGGSLTAWGIAKTKSRFKAAVVGAGVANWEGMVMESASPELEVEIGQRNPWSAPCSHRKISPVHDLHGVTTAVLILHGERDERVPVGQAIGLYRGLKRVAAKEGRETAQLVLYPREPHGFVEQKHAEDVMHRVLKHFHIHM